MIVPMRKAFVAAQLEDRDKLLKALAKVGAVHLSPVVPEEAVADEKTLTAIDKLRQAIQVLEATRPGGQPSEMAAMDAVDEILRIKRESTERNNKLSSLYRQIEQQAVWGDVRLDQFQELFQAGIELEFIAAPRASIADVGGKCVETVGSWSNKRALLAVVGRDKGVEPPEGSELVPLPKRDRPSLKAEASEIDAALKKDAAKLASLVHLTGKLKRERERLEAEAEWTAAERSAHTDDHFYVMQGWIPADLAETLGADLKKEGIDAAVHSQDPEPDEEPPTLVKYPWWAKPMKGLFEMLGTVPGYGEFDVSAMFMLFLPLFSAILICDAGYSAVYLAVALLLRKKMKEAGAGDLGNLITVVGVLGVVWGVITTTAFGYDFSRDIGLSGPLMVVDMTKVSMDDFMYLSVVFGAVHLSLAHLWKAWRSFPSLDFISEIGWAIWFWGMFGLVKMFLLMHPFGMNVFPYYPYMLIVGGILAVIFSSPDPNPLKMLGLGIANFPLSAIGTFGDTVSYVRLMAIGLGGSTLALTFNQMAGDLGFVAMILVLILGHSLDVALSIVSLLAHGVRLNMLEFSNNLGMQWSGYPYKPFVNKIAQES